MSTTDTRGELIDAAERIFARDGFEGASIREINRDADANAAAVHYHFRGKDGLVEAVLDRAVQPITKRRIQLFNELRADQPDGPLPTRRLVEAFLRPDFDAIGEFQARGPGRAALIGHAYGQPTDAVRQLMYRQFDPVAELYFPAFADALAPLSPEVVQWRLRWCVVGVIVALFSNADQPDGPIDATDRERSLQAAVDFVTGGMKAITS